MLGQTLLRCSDKSDLQTRDVPLGNGSVSRRVISKGHGPMELAAGIFQGILLLCWETKAVALHAAAVRAAF